MKNLLKKVICLFLLSAYVAVAFAQQVNFPAFGTITYEKSVNTYALIKEIIGPMPSALDARRFEQYQQTQHQFKLDKAILSFNGQKTIYQPVLGDANTDSYFNIALIGQKNVVFKDFVTKTTIVQKDVFDAEFLITDTIRHILWKLTDETREVAGYKCRRANGLTRDSLYVVAFYTDDIHIPAGPESFGGLPGMILLAAMPDQHIIWTAKEINISTPPQIKIQAPQKGKNINNNEFISLIREILKKRYNGTEYNMQLISFIL